MKIQPLTQPGRVYRLKGLGLAGADQLVTIDVLIPQQLTAEEVVLFRKLKDLSKERNPRESLFTNVQQIS
jgi:DnaJ-class molecular chaperone